MSKSKLFKIFSVIIISMAVTLCCTNVRAADDLEDDGFDSLDPIISNSNVNNTNVNNTNVNNTNVNNTNVNNANVNNTNNSSSYNNTNNLPKTGIEDSIPVAMLVVILGISSIYAYRKVKEYRNI